MSDFAANNLLLAELPALFADIEDFLGAIVPVIFVIIWVISQVMGATGKNKQQRPQAPRPAADPPPQPDLANEIDSFLKKIQSGGAAEPDMPAPAQVVEAELVEATPVAAPVAAPAPRRVSSLDTRPRSSSSIQQRHLDNAADDGVQAMERHRHEVFDHEIGSLRDTSDDIHETADREQERRDSDNLAADANASGERGAPEIPTTADEVRELFADAYNVRKAVVLSEVFARPSDRW